MPLSLEKKEVIIEKHKKLVDELNQYLPNELKIKYDDNLIERLNDEKEVKYYKTLNEIETITNKKQKAFDNLISKYGIASKEKNILARTLFFGLKAEDTPEAKEYNDKLYQSYLENPEKQFFDRYKNVLEFDPNILLEIGDDKQKLMDFYLKNQKLCEDAFCFSSQMEKPTANINPLLRKSISGLSKTVEVLSYPQFIYNQDLGDGYFSFPKNITKEQAMLIVNGNPSYMTKTNPLRGKFYPLLDDGYKTFDPLDGLKKIKKNGYQIGKGFFLKYACEKYDPKKDKMIEIPIENGIKEIDSENIRIRQRTQDEINEMLKINKAYDNEYLNIVQKRFSKNYDKANFNVDRILHNNKGRFFERLFRRTSREYKEFERAFRDYNNPQSPDYLNKERLKEKAHMYYDHKIDSGISISKKDVTAQNRLKLVSAVIKTLDSIDDDKIKDEISNNLKDIESLREPIVKESEVKFEMNDNIIEKNNNIIENELVK